MLSLLGYHVGKTQPLHPSVRECILEYVFECHLPPLADVAYFEEWGKPRSARRLQKLANTIAALTRNAKTRDPQSLSRAIDEWEQDLTFLYEQYYLRAFHFGWPATEGYVAAGNARSHVVADLFCNRREDNKRPGVPDNGGHA